MRICNLNLFVLIGMLLLATGCETTQLQTTWKDPSIGKIEFTKVAVLVLNSTPAERRAQEDEIVRQMKAGVGVATYNFVPDGQLRDRERVKQLIQESGADAAVVLRLVAQDKQTHYVPGSTSYWGSGYGYYPYSYSPGYYVTDTIIRAELSLYSIRYGKLLWAGSSSTTNPGTAAALASEVSRTAARELKRQGLLE